MNDTLAASAQRARNQLQSLTGRSEILFPGRASAGIFAALRAFGLKDQWVVMPANICYIAGWAVLQSSNRPYLADVDPATGNLSIESLNNVKLDRIGAVLVCHMYGLGAPIAEIDAWARERGIFLIEDAALALGAEVNGRPAGTWGDVSVFSFGSGKIADAGNGGALLTDDAALAAEIGRELEHLPEWSAEIAELENQWLQIYWALHQFEVTNPKLPALYPALYDAYGEITRYRLPDYPYDELVDALEVLPDTLAHRRRIAELYRKELAGLASTGTLDEARGSIYWKYPLLVGDDKRDGLLRHLWAEGFHEVTRWYPSLRAMLSTLVSEPCFAATPGADLLGEEMINLPVDADVDADTARWLAKTIRSYF